MAGPLGDPLLDAFERLRAAEQRKRQAPEESDEYRMRAREVEARAMELFEAAIWDEQRTQHSDDDPEATPGHRYPHH